MPCPPRCRTVDPPPSHERWNLEPGPSDSDKAGLSEVHLICAALDPRAKKLRGLPKTLKAHTWKVLEEILLNDVARKVDEKRDADIAAGRVLDEARDGAEDPSDGEAGGETKEQGNDKEPKSLARMVLEGDACDTEGSSDDEVSDLRELVWRPWINVLSGPCPLVVDITLDVAKCRLRVLFFPRGCTCCKRHH